MLFIIWIVQHASWIGRIFNFSNLNYICLNSIFNNAFYNKLFTQMHWTTFGQNCVRTYYIELNVLKPPYLYGSDSDERVQYVVEDRLVVWV